MLPSDFHCRENDGFGLYPYTQDSQDMLDYTNSYPDFINTIITVCTDWDFFVFECPFSTFSPVLSS